MTSHALSPTRSGEGPVGDSCRPTPTPWRRKEPWNSPANPLRQRVRGALGAMKSQAGVGARDSLAYIEYSRHMDALGGDPAALTELMAHALDQGLSGGFSALHLVLAYAEPSAARKLALLLLAQGSADANAECAPCGMPALHMAAERGDPELARMLWECPAVDAGARSSKGWTALAHARACGQWDCAEVFQGFAEIPPSRQSAHADGMLAELAGQMKWARQQVESALALSRPAGPAPSRRRSLPGERSVRDGSGLEIRLRAWLAPRAEEFVQSPFAWSGKRALGWIGLDGACCVPCSNVDAIAHELGVGRALLEADMSRTGWSMELRWSPLARPGARPMRVWVGAGIFVGQSGQGKPGENAHGANPQSTGIRAETPQTGE